jgi:cyclic-di-AMP phosphodiesterase PgpH
MKNFADYIHLLGQKDNRIVKGVILFLFILIVASLFPSGESIESDYRVGMIWTDKDLIAPFSFPIYKEEAQYQQERAEAAASVFKVFEEDQSVQKHAVDSLQKFFGSLQDVLDARILYARRERYAERHRKSHASAQDLSADSLRVVEGERSIPVPLTEKEWSALEKLRSADNRRTSFNLKALERDILLEVNELYSKGIANVRKSSFGLHTNVAFREKTNEQIVPLSKYLDQTEVGGVVEQAFASMYKQEGDTVSAATKIAVSFLSPNIIFQKDQTEKEINVAMDEVPRTVGVVQENERIIGNHERITDDIKLKLDSLRKAKAERGGDINKVTTFIGKFLHIFVVTWLFGIYIFLFRKNIFNNNAQILLILLIMLLEALFAYLTLQINAGWPIEFLIVVPTASMLFAIIFDSRVAFYGTVTVALIIAGVRGNDYVIMLCSVIAGSLAVYTVRDIKHRTQIFRSISFIFLGYFFSILALSLERYESISAIGQQMTLAGVNAVFSPVLTYGLLIFFERFFHVTTDLTLLELSDFNQPLLRELSQKAPGTFHHSVNMGTLAEAAAEAIGANAILARVGAYYHDIGKITKPAMFVENQLGTTNKHERMNPYMSARVIAAHVKDGITLGQEFGIPDVVLDFIPSHHGTTKIGFFYEQALRKKAKRSDPGTSSINPNDFRYSGPRPQTKETGIVMLADAVEAATRTIDQPTLQKIEENIDNIIKNRLMDGELDECDLTMSDLSKIKASFVKIATGIHHSRIKYPEQTTPVTAEKIEHSSETPSSTVSRKSSQERHQRRRIRSIDAS